ncbi:MAG: (2Fe-2S)-binding protein [Acidobacteriota bacterium]
MKERIRLQVNGEEHELLVPVYKTLLEVLREDLGLTGTKHGCELGECGTCTVLVDGEPYLSCLGLPVDLQGRQIETIEGLARNGRPHELQVAFAELGAAQCGYCTPGILMAAKALLEEQPAPRRQEIAAYLAGNLCRCTGYLQILEAVELAAERIARRAASGDPDPEHRPIGPQPPESMPDPIPPVEGKHGSAGDEGPGSLPLPVPVEGERGSAAAEFRAGCRGAGSEVERL